MTDGSSCRNMMYCCSVLPATVHSSLWISSNIVIAVVDGSCSIPSSSVFQRESAVPCDGVDSGRSDPLCSCFICELYYLRSVWTLIVIIRGAHSRCFAVCSFTLWQESKRDIWKWTQQILQSSCGLHCYIVFSTLTLDGNKRDIAQYASLIPEDQ